ncbi:putative D-lactate dehydrogenase [Peptoniphilus sp. ING2-D1G]|nr:putative D-lactate dehydrogenase [Peptoniphilus sp. ING2-D1G]
MAYDIIHFEALGKEALYLKKVTEQYIQEGKLPKGLETSITPLTLQDYLKENNMTSDNLPQIITTKTHSVLPEKYVNEGIKKSVITRSAGYDHFENLQKKINLTSLREYCVDAVSQTAVKFLYCVCGYLNEYTTNTKTFERNKNQSFKELNSDVVATIFGVGKIGSQVYKNFSNNGLKVQAVDVREDELKDDSTYADFIFVSKEEAIKNSDILVNVMNLTKNPNSRFYNEGYFTKEYLLQAMKPLYFINVTRGEIAPESIILKLLKNKKILGFATDVFSHEAHLTECLKNGTCEESDDKDIRAAKILIDHALNRDSNVYVQPHQGFNSDLAAKSKAVEAINHVEYWFNNGKKGFKEQLPYYK